MVLTLIIAFLSLIALMVIHEFGHFIIAKKFGVKVEEFGIGYPPRVFGKKVGETLYSINLLPLGAFVKIYGEEGEVEGLDDYRSFSNLAIWKRILIVLGGVLAFWIAAMIIFSVVFGIGAAVPIGDQDVQGFSDTYVKILAVEQGSPADVGGLMAGDKVVSLKTASQEMQVDKIEAFQKFVQENKGKPITLTLDRGGEMRQAEVTPRVEYPANQGPTGVALERMAQIIEKAPWYLAPFKGIAYTGSITWEALVKIYEVIENFFVGKPMPEGAALAGPVGITIFLARAVDYGPGFFLYFIGSLSVLIAIFNLFPIPALDGGKLLFLIIEKIKGKPVSVRLEQTLTVGFFLLLIAMSIFITVKFDFPRVVEFWKAG